MKCANCSEPAVEGRVRCVRHLQLATERTRRWTEENRAEINNRRRANYAAKPRRDKWAAALAKYGITPDDYLEMHEAQQGLCAICLLPETVRGNHGKVKNLVVDHDHRTGRVRGLLCNNCNRSIGLLADDPLLVGRAFLYLTDGLMA